MIPFEKLGMLSHFNQMLRSTVITALCSLSIPALAADHYTLQTIPFQGSLLNDLLTTGSGWFLNDVYAINNAGQILVSGNKGFALLSPVKNPLQALCDVNQDHQVNINDLRIIYNASRPHDLTYDIDQSGALNINDLRKCVLQCSKSQCAL